MDLWNDGPLAEVREKYADILLAQLLDSSEEFREWFVGRTTSAQGIAEYYGVRCNEGRYGRETDLMFGFKGVDGDDYLILVENKIKAQEQAFQFADYHNRGESYIDSGACDQYVVCLFAPKQWVKPKVKKNVDRILLYEDVMDQLEALDYDGVEFIQTVLSQSIDEATPSVLDFSHITQELWRRINVESSHDLQPHSVTGKHLRCTSAHSDHPNFVLYNIYLSQPGEFGHSILRIQIKFDEPSWVEKTDIDKNRLKAQFGTAIDRLLRERHPEFRGDYENIRSQTTTVILKKLPHEEMPPFESDEYFHTLVEEFGELIEKVHPVICSIDFRAISREIT